MSILEQIGVGLITDGIGLIFLLAGLKIMKSRIIESIKFEIGLFIKEYTEFVAQNPQILKPMLDSVIKSVVANPAGIMPKEATIKVPIFGKIPARMVEPLIKAGMKRFLPFLDGEEKTESDSSPFG